jgi:hypothetical protein
MKHVIQVTLCISLLAAALPAAALAAEEFPRDGLILWLKQDAGITKDAANKITAWQDQSGAGNHASGAAATAPVFTTEGGRSFARFDGTSFLDLGSAVSASNFTVVAAIRFGGSATPKFTFWFGGDGQGFYAGGGGLGSREGKNIPYDGWGVYRGTAEGYPWLLTKDAVTDFGIISLTSKHLYRNGNDMTALPPYLFQDKIPGFVHTRLGGNAGGEQNFSGDISEVLVYNQSLTTKERGIVESYLMDRYNVAATPNTSPAGVGPTGKSGLALWLKSDAGITKDGANKITAWQDQSGAGRHATNADAATAPVFTTEGGRGFARFNKTNWLNCAVSEEKYTVFAVIRAKDPQFVKYDPHHDAYSFWFGGEMHGLVAGGRSSLGGNTTHPLGWGIQFGERGWKGQILGTTVDTGFIVMTVNNHQLWRNGKSDVDILRTNRDVHLGIPEPLELDWNVPAINLTRLGGIPGTPYQHDANFPGDIAEVLIYDKTLSAPERGMVEDYLQTKYSALLLSNVPARGYSFTTETEHLGMQVLPAPGKVDIDGKFDDWDLTAGIFACGDVDKLRDQVGQWFHVMYDAENLYVLARWKDPTPLNNPGVKGDKGFAGDCLQFRTITTDAAVKERTAHFTCWKLHDGGNLMDINYGQKLDEGNIPDAKTEGAKQVFAIDADGKGYVQELAIPWKLLTADQQPLNAGDRMVMTLEPNFTADQSGRITIKDIFKPGVQIDRDFTFQSPACWGYATLEKTGKLKPRPVRLSDGRELAVTMEAGLPVVNWTGLVQSQE